MATSSRALIKPMAGRTGKSCNCNLSYMVLAWILFAIGLYFIVGGFAGQFTGTASAAYVLFAYFIGFVIMTLGKMAKWTSHKSCPVHSD